MLKFNEFVDYLNEGNSKDKRKEIIINAYKKMNFKNIKAFIDDFNKKQSDSKFYWRKFDDKPSKYDDIQYEAYVANPKSVASFKRELKENYTKIETLNFTFKKEIWFNNEFNIAIILHTYDAPWEVEVLTSMTELMKILDYKEK